MTVEDKEENLRWPGIHDKIVASCSHGRIVRDTVEEKVLELPATKRRVADAIVRADESLIRDLRREDLELLLS